MAWDDDKSTASDPDNPTADEQVTADEWDAMVADQKTRITGVDVENDGTLVLKTDTIDFGTNLSATDNGDGTVTIDASSGGGVDVSEDGTLVVSTTSDINFTSNLTVTDDGDGTVTVDVSDPLTVDTFTVNTSITDPAGVEHTGELADASDVGGGSSGTELRVSAYGTDGTAIQSALDEANTASGHAVVIIDQQESLSEYTVNNAPLEVYDDTTIVVRENVALGDNQDANLFESQGCHGTSPTVRDNIHFIGQGGVLDWNRANNVAGGSPSGFYANCINLMATNSSVQNLELLNPLWHGVNIHGHSDNVLVEGCTIRNSDGGIQAHWHEADDVPFSNVKINNCTVEGNATGDTGAGAFWISGGEAVTVSNCYVESHAGHGINLYNGDNSIPTNDLTVTNNVVRNTGGGGVRLYTSSNGTGNSLTDIEVSNTIIRSAGGEGVFIEGGNETVEQVDVTNLQVKDSTERGIYITPDGAGAHHVTIENCTIDGTTNWLGIQVGGSNSSNIKILDSTVLNAAHHGIAVSGPDCVIADCTTSNNANSGISALSENVTVENNISKNNNQGGNVDSNAAGIALNSTSDRVVVGNRCYDDQGTKTQEHGIYVVSGSDYSIISNNNIRGNANVGVGGTTGSNAIVTDNIT